MGFLSNLFNFRTNLSEHDRSVIWKMFGSFDTNHFDIRGNSLIKNSFEKNVDVYAVIKKIIDITKSHEWIIEQKQASGKWKVLSNTPIHDLIDRPNENKNYTWNDIEEQIITYLLVTGNAYIVGEQPIGMNGIAEIDVLPTAFVEIKSNESFFNPDLKYNFQLGSSKRTFTKEDLQHVKFFNPAYNSVLESHYGLSIIQVASQVIQVGNDKWDASANLFQNRGAVGMITDKSQRPMTQEETDKVQGVWDRNNSGVKKFGKITVTNKDLNYISMAMSPSDLQLIESGVVNLRAICNVFGLDSSLFNDPDNKTYSNRTEAEKSLYTNAIIPLSDKLSEALTNFICRNYYPDKTVRMRQDFSKVEALQENKKDKTEILTSQVSNGIITPNEARVKLGEPKHESPEADVLRVSKNNNQNDTTNINN